ncbi:MAG TPA: PTS transporter subunit EIIC, partial [Microbacterium sp.]|uniref:PTS transporter subunit EIIC n=1 Tax=Microbacterium sp. TaxID=51671 RepID=UPI002CEC7165
MTTASTPAKGTNKARVGVQRFGTYLSGMIMPNIPALIAWGIFTAFFIDVGWTPNADLATIVGPFIHYALPILIAYTGGSIVYGIRGGVVAVIGTFGVIAGSDLLVTHYNAAAEAAGNPPIPEIHQFIGAMIMAPIAAYSMKWLDSLWEGKIKPGFEMLVNMF